MRLPNWIDTTVKILNRSLSSAQLRGIKED